jgi:hypothetical protein
MKGISDDDVHQVRHVAPDRAWEALVTSDPTRAIVGLPASAARMLAVEILLADPEALGDDILESCLYLLREKLRTAAGSDKARCGETADAPATRVTEGPAPAADAPGEPCDEA